MSSWSSQSTVKKEPFFVNALDRYLIDTQGGRNIKDDLKVLNDITSTKISNFIDAIEEDPHSEKTATALKEFEELAKTVDELETEAVKNEKEIMERITKAVRKVVDEHGEKIVKEKTEASSSSKTSVEEG